MDLPETCDKVIRALNGHLLEGQPTALAVKLADGNKKRQLAKSVGAAAGARLWRDAEPAPRLPGYQTAALQQR